MPKRSSKSNPPSPNSLLVEVAWEVCNQVGGIYTVIRSKAPAIMENWNGRFCMIGPYVNKNIHAELEPLEDAADIFGLAAANLRKKGYDVMYAEWLITGKPRPVPQDSGATPPEPPSEPRRPSGRVSALLGGSKK